MVITFIIIQRKWYFYVFGLISKIHGFEMWSFHVKTLFLNLIRVWRDVEVFSLLFYGQKAKDIKQASNTIVSLASTVEIL